MTNEPKLGQLVGYSSDFCRRIGPAANKKRGVIVQIYQQVRPNGPYRVTVLWHGDDKTQNCLTSNLTNKRG